MSQYFPYKESKFIASVEIKERLNTKKMKLWFFVRLDLIYADESKEKMKRFRFWPENMKIFMEGFL